MDALTSMFYRKKYTFETSGADNAANKSAIESGHSFETRIQNYTSADVQPEVSIDCEPHVTCGQKRRLESEEFARKRGALREVTNEDN